MAKTLRKGRIKYTLAAWLLGLRKEKNIHTKFRFIDNKMIKTPIINLYRQDNIWPIYFPSTDKLGIIRTKCCKTSRTIPHDFLVRKLDLDEIIVAQLFDKLCEMSVLNTELSKGEVFSIRNSQGLFMQVHHYSSLFQLFGVFLQAVKNRIRIGNRL